MCVCVYVYMSIFYPPRNRNKELETHISFKNNINIINEKSNKKSNFPLKEWTKLRNLMNQPDIVIKEADKGGAVTVLSKNHYRAIKIWPHYPEKIKKTIKQIQKYFHR